MSDFPQKLVAVTVLSAKTSTLIERFLTEEISRSECFSANELGDY